MYLMIIITANDINSNENSQIKSDSLNMKIQCIPDFLNIFSNLVSHLHPAARQFCRSTYTITDNTIK
jgi:hypothetical protein